MMIYSYLWKKVSVIKYREITFSPGADSGGERKSKRAGKYGTKKSKERRDWAEKHKSFLAPIRSQNDGDSLELVW